MVGLKRPMPIFILYNIGQNTLLYWYSKCMSKQTKYVVAAILKNKQNPDEFLVVKRPDDDPDLGGHWGFPAATMKPGELPEEAAKRICKEKLNCEAEATRFLGIMFQKRNSYDIFLMDVDMMLSGDS